MDNDQHRVEELIRVKLASMDAVIQAFGRSEPLGEIREQMTLLLEQLRSGKIQPDQARSQFYDLKHQLGEGPSASELLKSNEPSRVVDEDDDFQQGNSFWTTYSRRRLFWAMLIIGILKLTLITLNNLGIIRYGSQPRR